MKIEKNAGYAFKCVINSGNEEYPGCKLYLAFGKWFFTFGLPPIIKPDVLKVRGKYNYDELIERRYGTYLFDNHFNILYGRGDANFHRDIFGKEQRWSCFLPWNEWRFVRFSLYDLDGKEFFTNWYTSSREVRRLQAIAEEEARGIVPIVTFRFTDYDGEEIEATTHIEEREWRRGEKLFKWLSWFYSPKIRRSLDIQFNKETGPRKGSWKGGTIGHGTEIEPDELHEGAFRRYCQQHNMTFLA